jgi:hypothetical protein
MVELIMHGIGYCVSNRDVTRNVLYTAAPSPCVQYMPVTWLGHRSILACLASFHQALYFLLNILYKSWGPICRVWCPRDRY